MAEWNEVLNNKLEAAYLPEVLNSKLEAAYLPSLLKCLV